MVLVTFTLLLIIVTILLIKFRRRYELGNRIPGPWSIPLIGNFEIANHSAERLFIALNDFNTKYPGVFRIWLSVKLWVFLSEPILIEKVLNDHSLPKAKDFDFLSPLIGTGLLISNGKKWQTRRKGLTPAFHFRILDDFVERFSHTGDVLVQKLPNGESVEMTSILLLCMLDAVCETAMGAEVNAQLDPDGDYVKAFHETSRILFRQMANPLLQFDLIFRWFKDYERVKHAIGVIHGLTDKVIKEKRQKLLETTDELVSFEDEFGRKQKLTLIDILMQSTFDGQNLADDDIREEINTFLFAGIDTTKSALSFLLYNLAKYPDIQNKVVEEIHSVMGTDPLQTIDHKSVNELKYMDLVIKESMRYHTTVPVTGRQTLNEYQLGDLLIPKDTTLWINIFGMSHNSFIYPNPDEFLPERFDIKSNTSKTNSYAYIPFSAGPHICIGKKYALLTMKTITAKLLLNYNITLSNPEEHLELICEMVLKSKTGINLIFTKRI